MRSVVVVLVVLLVVLGRGATAHAQIVNVQGALTNVPEGITGTGEVKFDWREGNNALFDLSGTGTLRVNEGRLLALVLARGGYGESRGFVLTRKSFEHARTRIGLCDPTYVQQRRREPPRKLSCRWKWEAFVQHEFDQFKRLTFRAIAGTGPAFQIFETDDHEFGLLAGAAYLFNYERLDTRPGTIDAGKTLNEHRASFYLTGKQQLSSHVTLIETVYAQPRLDELSDLRMLGEFTVQTKLQAHIALTNGITVAYDDRPPDGIVAYDTELRIGVLVTW